MVEEAGGVGFVTGDGAVGLGVAGCAAFGAVGVVRAAGCRGPRAVGGELCAGGVVAVQVVECGAVLDRNAQAAEGVVAERGAA